MNDPHATAAYGAEADGVEDSSLATAPGGRAGGNSLPTVPGYRVLREIARGGMGRVLAARDLALDRDVALKVLLPGANADRFVRESKITARLPHPGIPPVHAMGTLSDGSPFLAMKLVVGQTLSAETRTAGLPRLMQAFAQVCEAVGFAHSRDVVHRDLKPANVMVGTFGEVLVMDWGLAKELADREGPDETRSTAASVLVVGEDAIRTADHRKPGVSTVDQQRSTDRSAPGTSTVDQDRTTDRGESAVGTGGQTQAGTVLGTPAYMAPEVARGEAATKAADVYGLGAILYALLAGRPPFEGASAADVLRKVATADPDLFVAANSTVPPALVAICRKAMARSPAGRYPSADDLGTDVRRWLADEPVSAYREPWSARAVRWARRRKTTVVAAGVLLLTAAVAATASAGLVWREQLRTLAEWQRAEDERLKATANADTAITVVRDLSSYIRLVELSGSRQSVTDRQRKAALDVALASYERLFALHPDDAGVRSTVALTHRFRANLSRVLGETGEAEKSYLAASRHYGELAAIQPEVVSHRVDLALTSRDYALLLKTLGRLKEAAEILHVAIPRLEELRRADPDNPSRRRTLGMALLDRAELDFVLDRFADAERHARLSMDLYAGLPETTGAEPLDPLFCGMAEIRLATALRELGRIEDALAVHDRVVGRLGAIAKTTAGREYVLEHHRAQAERAWTLARTSDRQAAGIADLDGAIAGLEKLAKQFPSIPSYPRTQGMGTLYRGRLNALLGRREAAAKDLNAAAAIFEGLVGKHPDIPGFRSFLGQAQLALGHLETDSKKANERYRQARETLAEALRRNPENALDRRLLAELDARAKSAQP